MTIRRRIRWGAILGVAIVLGFAGAMFTYERFFREQPPPFFESDEDHFLFGSVGTEAGEGVPYWIWLVLPRVFPDLLPGAGGYASLGILGKDGHEMPVGLSKVTIGIPRVGINCAVCHAASVRLRPEDPPTIVAGAPAHQLAAQGYVRFLGDAAADPRFTASTLLAEISRNVRLSTLDRLLYRFAIIPATRRGLLRRRNEESWMADRTEWGPGRIDPFNSVKFRMLHQPIDQTIGNSDMVPLWNFRARTKHAYHWDGLNTDLREVVTSSAIGDGATYAWVDRDYLRWDQTAKGEMSSLRRVMNFISERQPPKFPLPIDERLAAQGADVFRAECASCHAPDGARTGQVIPVQDVGTDRHRLDMWTAGSARAYNDYGNGRQWVFSSFRTSDGYVAVPLDGLWLRGPYLHNGSVPSLADLLEPPDKRPAQFWRGYDVIDPARGGFVSDGAEARRIGAMFDTSRPGNSNAGHVYGTSLPAESKRALVEYLKTL